MQRVAVDVGHPLAEPSQASAWQRCTSCGQFLGVPDLSSVKTAHPEARLITWCCRALSTETNPMQGWLCMHAVERSVKSEAPNQCLATSIFAVNCDCIVHVVKQYVSSHNSLIKPETLLCGGL